LILKRGDWLLKTAAGWRNIKRPQEIEDCLYHRLKGELFIFDAIEKEGGKMVLKGNLFDEMRTQAHPVTILIENEKKAPKKGRPRKLPFSSTAGAAILISEGIAKLQFGAKSVLFVQDPDSAQIAFSKSSMSICERNGPAQKPSNLASKASFAIPSSPKANLLP